MGMKERRLGGRGDRGSEVGILGGRLMGGTGENAGCLRPQFPQAEKWEPRN